MAGVVIFPVVPLGAFGDVGVMMGQVAGMVGQVAGCCITTTPVKKNKLYTTVIIMDKNSEYHSSGNFLR